MRMSPYDRKPATSQTLKIRIPKAVWNAYEPSNKRRTRLTTRTRSSEVTKATLKIDRQATTAALQSSTGAAKTKEPSTERIRSTDCKVRLWTFHYGGPKRVVKGKAKNDIGYNTPCLQLTCKTCLRWHSHLIEEPESQSNSFKQQPHCRPAIEPISPDIDPRILDGSWQFCNSRRGSASTAQSSMQLEMITTPQLTPVKHSFDSEMSSSEDSVSPHPPLDDIPSVSKWQVSLPIKLIAQATATTCAQTRWRAAPREQYVVRLTFLSHEGKKKFIQLLRKRERKLKKRIYDRERRERLKTARGV